MGEQRQVVSHPIFCGQEGTDEMKGCCYRSHKRKSGSVELLKEIIKKKNN
jgi:hypothetical protein